MNKEKSLENTEIHTENWFSSPSIQKDEFTHNNRIITEYGYSHNNKIVTQDNGYRMVTEQSTFTLNEDEMLKMSTEKQLHTKTVSKNEGNNDCYDENDGEPTLEFKINVPVHLCIAKDRNGNGFNLKSIDLGQSKNKEKGNFDKKCIDRNGKGSKDQNLFRTDQDLGNTVEKAVKHTEKPFSLVKFVSNLFHADPNPRKKSSIGDYDDDDLSVERELFGENGLFDVEQTTARKTGVEGSFWNTDEDEDKFGAEISRNPKESQESWAETTGEESFESARVIMPQNMTPRLPKDGSEHWNRDGLSMQNAQPRLEDLNGPKFPQRTGIIEFQPFLDRLMNDGNENYFPPRGVLSFM
ncbi:hypothetical protein LSTR_LSTR003426 [Laodelphax striatellus]|uniref:Uncharacterized protein n=1 Tax=Laodelphax striatellus TaxID=195883 RepID=A0A482X1L4_LAOST|nr:hypothetical protein LSTR_LSTR003426 [Laodelphax striatellus]